MQVHRASQTRAAIVALTLASTTLSCVEVSPFVCLSDAQCDRVRGARCFEAGCAIPDAECDDGYRYADDARGTAAGTCVAAGGSSTTAYATSSATSSSGSSSAGTAEATEPGTTGGFSSSSGGATSSSGSTSSRSSSGTTGCGPEECTCAAALSSGNQYNCLLRDDGSVVCWGRNDRGQGGTVDEGFEQLNHPTVVDLGGNAAVEVATHHEHSCARIDDGTVWCWGRNLTGAVDPTNVQDVPLTPQPVDGLQGAVAVRAGLRTTCVRLEDDMLSCFGTNDFGELLSEEPEPGPALSGPYAEMVDFRLGFYHGCLWDASSVQCWGRNNRGQVAAESYAESFATPVSVEGMSNPLSVAVGRNHVCAALSDGTVWCWGDNEFGQVSADEMTARYNAPQQVEQTWEGEVARIFTLTSTTCVETSQAELWCWGGTYGGYFGIEGLNNGPRLWPPRRSAAFDELPAPIADLGLGLQHICTVLDTAEVYCWGNSNVGQIGPSLPKNDADTVELYPCEP